VKSRPEESTISQLAQTVTEVQGQKSHYAELVNSFARYWTPAIITSSILLLVIGGSVSRNWLDFIQRACILLVLACPCSIVISTPIPSSCAIAMGAKRGVLIRGGRVLDILYKFSYGWERSIWGVLTRGVGWLLR
jgi:Cd2+/Zn2+-exporting ATPase